MFRIYGTSIAVGTMRIFFIPEELKTKYLSFDHPKTKYKLPRMSVFAILGLLRKLGIGMGKG